jgi:hypothetical protein
LDQLLLAVKQHCQLVEQVALALALLLVLEAFFDKIDKTIA